MKIVIFKLILLLLCACNAKSDKTSDVEFIGANQLLRLIVKEVERFPIFPLELIQKEYIKSQNVHSHHSLFKKEFAFNEWLIEINDKDSIQTYKYQIDSILFNPPKKERAELNLSDEWHLNCLVMKGWYEFGLDKTDVNRIFVSKKNKFRLTGTELFQIFKATEGWSANMINDDELMIRYWYFYLNGNQTSWDYSHIYLFTKR